MGIVEKKNGNYYGWACLGFRATFCPAPFQGLQHNAFAVRALLFMETSMHQELGKSPTKMFNNGGQIASSGNTNVMLMQENLRHAGPS